VTTIPYHCSRQEKSIWLDRGSMIRRQTGMPWIVLHHVPAKTGLGVSGGEELEASALLAAYGLIALSRAMIMCLPTRLANAGTKNWASHVC
jgi:hypothetical protein